MNQHHALVNLSCISTSFSPIKTKPVSWKHKILLGHFPFPYLAKFSFLSPFFLRLSPQQNWRFVELKSLPFPMWTIALKTWGLLSLESFVFHFSSPIEDFPIGIWNKRKKLSVNQLVVLIISQLICISERNSQLINAKTKRNHFVMKPNEHGNEWTFSCYSKKFSTDRDCMVISLENCTTAIVLEFSIKRK